MRIDTAIHAGGGSMEIIEQLFAGEGLTRAAGENLYQFVFVGRELDRAAVKCDGVFVEIDFQASHADDTWRLDITARSAQERPHTRHQCTHRERLGNIIVRADLETRDLIDLF